MHRGIISAAWGRVLRWQQVHNGCLDKVQHASYRLNVYDTLKKTHTGAYIIDLHASILIKWLPLYRLQYLMFLREKSRALFSWMDITGLLPPSFLPPGWILSSGKDKKKTNTNPLSCDGNKIRKIKNTKTLTYLIHLARGRDASVVRALQINARTRLHKSPREREREKI